LDRAGANPGTIHSARKEVKGKAGGGSRCGRVFDNCNREPNNLAQRLLLSFRFQKRQHGISQHFSSHLKLEA
jgi:hypothetical protein